MLDDLYHIFNYIIAACYFVIFLLIFTGLLREKAFGRNALGTATSGIFLTCSLGHLTHATTSHVSGQVWEAGLQVAIDGWTIMPAVAYLILRRKFGLIIKGPDMINEYRVQLAAQSSELKAMRRFEQLKDDFMAMASHELRTPLTTIKGYAQILTKRVEQFNDKRVSVAVETINQQVDRMSDLIGMLLDVSRIQSGKLQLRPVKLDLAELTAGLVNRLQITSARHQLNLSLPPEPAWVMADSDRLEQVITNLVGNAIKYSAEADRVDLTVENGPTEVCLKVTDYGQGIAAEELPRIFDRFYRSPEVKNSNKEGLGLGLYICSEILRASGGQIEVTSQPGAGTTFTVKLPRLQVAAPQPASLTNQAILN